MKDPLEYMVEDCWLHLFKFLSADDKQALCDTCETFHAMLQPQKVNWAFELILPHVTKYLPQYNPQGYIEGVRQLSFNLNVRLVCKSWQATIDKVCGGCWLHSSIQRKYDFRDASKLEKFINFFKHYRGNPIIGRSVTIYASYVGELEDVKSIEEPKVIDEGNAENNENEEAEKRWVAERRARERERSLKNRKLQMELLFRYGEEIEHLSISQDINSMLHNESSNIELDACKFLHLVLSKTPNLQVLKLSLRQLLQDKESAFQITEYFELNPLPRMPKLRELTLYDNNPKIANLLLEAYGVNLQILWMHSENVEIPLSVWGNFKCLKSLELWFSNFESNVKLLQALHSPLEILSIRETYQGRRDLGQWLIDKFLLAVQHLPLKKIEVYPARDIVKESAPFPAHFPKLFTITEFIIHNVRTTSVTFLQFLPNLQKQIIDRDKFYFLSNHISKKSLNPICTRW